jgi:hypothetical protein
MHERSSSPLPPGAWLDVPSERAPSEDRKEQALAQIMEHGVLSHVFGRHGEYKVRSTMTTRQIWQYRSFVLYHGKAIKRAFFPIIVEHRPPTLYGGLRPSIGEDMRLSFAREAVDVHFTRCAALQEYLLLAVLYDQQPKPSRRWYALLAPMVGVAAMVAYGFWAHALRPEDRPAATTTAAVVVAQPSGGESMVGPLPTPSRTTNRSTANGQGGQVEASDREEVPRTISVTELLALQAPAENTNHPLRASSAGLTASDLRVGDVIHVSGWIRRVSRARDATYHLHVAPDRQASAQVLVASVPPPTQAQDFAARSGQLQAVRTFIRQQLLQRREPSSRGSVIQRPVFVQLTGQLALLGVNAAERSHGKGFQAAPAHWGLRPTLDVQFAVP